MTEWRISDAPVDYPEALRVMEERVEALCRDEAEELVWLLEHPPIYTAGTSARPSDLLHPRFPVHKTGRGGQYTYHGPGQRVAYVMLDLKKRAKGATPDLRKYVQTLEQWLIATLRHFGVEGVTREGRIGIWVDNPAGEAKIAALGVRIRRGVSYHGVSLNLSPDLSHFSGIIPCGIKDYGVTSLAALGHEISAEALDFVLKKEFFRLF